MNTLKGTQCYLRALERSDLDILYKLENDESVWEVSNTTSPYSKYVLKKYLENAHRDIYDVKQLRLVICASNDERLVGFIDLFDFEPKHRRVGVGIVIISESDKNKGFASEALKLIEAYAFKHLQMHQIYANISEDNTVSIKLFEKLGYRKAGTRVDWICKGSDFKNELIYQRINNES